MARKYKHTTTKYKALIYGQPGAGKTRLAATAQLDDRLSPALMLDAFGNPISLGDYPEIPDIVTLEEMTDFNPMYEWLLDGQDPKAEYCKDLELSPPYKTLIVDGLTEVQRFVIRKILGDKVVHPGNLQGRLDFQGFGQLLGTMLRWAVHYVALDMNVILTSLEHTASKPTYYKPLLWGQTGNEMSGYVHQVVRLTTQLAAPKALLRHKEDPVIPKETNNVALFRATPVYYAKDQYGIPEEHLTDPTLTKILDLIERSSPKSK